jgi:hypothetical protein
MSFASATTRATGFQRPFMAISGSASRCSHAVKNAERSVAACRPASWTNCSVVTVACRCRATQSRSSAKKRSSPIRPVRPGAGGSVGPADERAHRGGGPAVRPGRPHLPNGPARPGAGGIPAAAHRRPRPRQQGTHQQDRSADRGDQAGPGRLDGRRRRWCSTTPTSRPGAGYSAAVAMAALESRRPDSVTVTRLLLGAWRRRDVTTLPLVSRIRLQRAADRISALGYRFEVASPDMVVAARTGGRR